MAGTDKVQDEAFVTLVTNDTYALGALVLAHSLRGVGTTRQIAVMITTGVAPSMRQLLADVFDLMVVVDVLDSRDTMNLALLTRPDLGVTFTKLHCWRLTQYRKCVFMDADTLVLQNIDELFEREELSAAPDAGWPDCFNSGVFVFCPSEATYESLLQYAVTHGSFDGGDQGLLNLYFSDWATKDINRHLPFIYNVVSQAFYSYLPAFKQFGHNVKVVHFIGAIKPWHYSYNTATQNVEETSGETLHSQDFLKKWWALFMSAVQPNLTPGMVGVVEGLASVSLKPGDPSGHVYTMEELSDRQRQYAWERGQIDYMGIDSFANIKRKLDEAMGLGAASEEAMEEAAAVVETESAPTAEGQ